MNQEMRVGVLLIAVLLLAGCGGNSRRDYLTRNGAIVQSLPRYPGAVEWHEISTPEYGKGEASNPTGYTTTVVYRVPRGTTGASVQRYYATRLGRSGWRSVINPTVRRFTKGRALVALNTVFLAPAQRRLGEQIYDLVVDYRGAGPG
jgi:hypothetical protein